MKKYIFTIILLFVCLPFCAQTFNAQQILDKLADTFKKNESVQLAFDVKMYDGKQLIGESSGLIQLQGEKFKLVTPDAITWFNGKTQWSYLIKNEEVNISEPTIDELQTINPYSLLYLYRNGYVCSLGNVHAYAGKDVIEIIMKASNRSHEWSEIILYVLKNTYQPLYIQLKQRDTGNLSIIQVTDYTTTSSCSDTTFEFCSKDYPQVEVIDLR